MLNDGLGPAITPGRYFSNFCVLTAGVILLSAPVFGESRGCVDYISESDIEAVAANLAGQLRLKESRNREGLACEYVLKTNPRAEVLGVMIIESQRSGEAEKSLESTKKNFMMMCLPQNASIGADSFSCEATDPTPSFSRKPKPKAFILSFLDRSGHYVMTLVGKSQLTPSQITALGQRIEAKVASWNKAFPIQLSESHKLLAGQKIKLAGLEFSLPSACSEVGSDGTSARFVCKNTSQKAFADFILPVLKAKGWDASLVPPLKDPHNPMSALQPQIKAAKANQSLEIIYRGSTGMILLNKGR